MWVRLVLCVSCLVSLSLAAGCGEFEFEDKKFFGCTRFGSSNKKPWCSINPTYEPLKQWRFCDKEEYEKGEEVRRYVEAQLKDKNSAIGEARSDDDCNEFGMESDRMAHGGEQVDGVSSVDGCTEACLTAKKKSCVGFDFNYVFSKCYLHKELAIFNDDLPGVGVDHYYLECLRGEYDTTPAGPVVTPPIGGPSSTTKRPGPGVCTDDFDLYADMFSYGGHERAEGNTLKNCKSLCLADQNCRGFDYARRQTIRCFLHFDDFEVNNPVESSETGEVDHYVRKPCSGTPTPATPPVVTPTPSEECQDTFDKYKNQFSYGGVSQQAGSVDECGEACLEEEECLGYDWDKKPKPLRCHLHFDSESFVDVWDNDEVDQYIRQACAATTPTSEECEDSFIEFPNLKGDGGTGVAGPSTVDECEDTCREDDTCLGFNFKKSGAVQCFTHTEAYEVDDLTSNNKFKYYLRDPCEAQETVAPPAGTTVPSVTEPVDPECTDQFKLWANMRDGAAVKVNLAKDVETCQGYCLANDGCGAFEFEPNAKGNKCWVIMKWGLTFEDLSPEGGRDHYQRLPCETITPTVCADSFETFESRRGGKGTDFTSAKTKEACQEICVEDDACEGYTFRSGSGKGARCRTHDKKVDEGDLLLGASYQYYAIQRCLEPTTAPVVGSTAVGGGTPAAPTTPGCEDSFTEHTKSKMDGEENVLARTQAACEEICAVDSDCGGYSFNAKAKGVRCTITAGEISLDDLSSNKNFKFYERIRCEETAVPTTAPGGIVTTPGCEDTFEPFLNMRPATQGFRQADANNMESCKEVCLADTVCESFDYKRKGRVNKRCYLHYDYVSEDDLVAQSTENHYRRIRCDAPPEVTPTECEDSFEEYSSRRAPNGQKQSLIKSLEDCRLNCLDDAECQAFDYNTGKGKVKCYLHYTGTMATLETKAGYTHYRRQSCIFVPTTADCVESFTMFENSHGFGATKIKSVDTLTDCKEACIIDTSCTAVDWNEAHNVPCWFYYDSKPSIEEEDGIDHYQIERCFTLTTEAGAGTTLGVCTKDTFEVYAEKKIPGGDLVGSAKKQEACEDACLDDSACSAFSFRAGNNRQARCFVFTTNSAIYDLVDDTRYSSYNRIRCVEGTTLPAVLTTEGCTDTFDKTSNRRGGADNPTEDTDLEDCEQSCVSSYTCEGFSYRKKGSGDSCYLHTFMDDLGTNKNFDAFTRTRCVEPTTAPPCVDEYVLFNNKRGPDGEEFDASSSVDCEEGCTSSYSCEGYTYKKKGGGKKCFLHDLAFADDDLLTNNGYNYYSRSRCTEPTTAPPCIEYFDVMRNKRVKGGVPQDGISSSEDCQDACLDALQCSAISYKKRGSGDKCFFHMFVPNDNDIGASTSYDFYSRVRCWELTTVIEVTTAAITPTVCFDSFEEMEDQRVTDDKARDFRKIEDCEEACLEDDLCNGYNFRPGYKGTRCYHVLSDIKGDSIVDNNKFIFYMRNRCFESMPTTVPACEEDFDVTRRKRGPGGAADNARSEDDCKDACLEDEMCYGISFRTSGGSGTRCFLHDSEISPLSSRNNYDFFERVRCGEPPVQPTEGCGADIIFIVDSSNDLASSLSRREDTFDDIKEFLRNVITRLYVSEEKSNIAVIEFADTASTFFDLNDYFDVTSMANDIASMTFQGGDTNLPDALIRASNIAGKREEYGTLVVVISNGYLDDYGAELDSAFQTMNRKLSPTVLAVGTNAEFSRDTFNVLTGGCDASGHCYSMRNFPLFFGDLTELSEPGCILCGADVAFLLDSSGSIEDFVDSQVGSNWGRMIEFIQSIVSELAIWDGQSAYGKKNEFQIGAVVFGNEARIEFDFANFTDAEDINEAFDDIEYVKENTNTSGGLWMTRTQLFTEDHGARENVPKVMFVLTDGKPTREENTLPDEARMVQEEGVIVFGIGITNATDDATMEMIVSTPTEKYYYRIDEFSQLDDLVFNFVRSQCIVYYPSESERQNLKRQIP